MRQGHGLRRVGEQATALHSDAVTSEQSVLRHRRVFERELKRNRRITSELLQTPPPCTVPDGPVATPRLWFTWSPSSTIGPPLESPTPKMSASPVELILIAFAMLPLIVLFWTVNGVTSPKSSSAPKPPRFQG